MAKKGSPKRGPAEPVASSAALEAALATFRRGDYKQSRVLLAAVGEDPSQPEGVRGQARQLLSATHPDRVTILSGLACAALYLLVALATSLYVP